MCIFITFFNVVLILSINIYSYSISDPTDEETERAVMVKPFSWWASIILKDKEIRVLTIGGSNTAG